ncbi:MAG: hypothetical protein K2J07_05705 [Muribaculaceae bacterium]|nr:hypothetical protein [Muribaculaceae bacterium]
MKRFSIVAMLLLICIMAFAAPKKMAVYVDGDATKSQKTIVSSCVLARMSGSKDYSPFERNDAFLKALTKEQDFQLSGEVPEREIRAVGKRLGVDYVLAVNIIITDDGYCHMSGRLINLETGAIVKSVNQKREYENSEVLTAMANNIAYRLLNKNSK